MGGKVGGRREGGTKALHMFNSITQAHIQTSPPPPRHTAPPPHQSTSPPTTLPSSIGTPTWDLHVGGRGRDREEVRGGGGWVGGGW